MTGWGVNREVGWDVQSCDVDSEYVDTLSPSRHRREYNTHRHTRLRRSLSLVRSLRLPPFQSLFLYNDGLGKVEVVSLSLRL